MSEAPVVQMLPSAVAGVRRMLVRDAAGNPVEVVEATATRIQRLPQGGVFSPFRVEDGRLILGAPLARSLEDLAPHPAETLALAERVLTDLERLHSAGGAHGGIHVSGWGIDAEGWFRVRPTLHEPGRDATPMEVDVAAIGEVVRRLLADHPLDAGGLGRLAYWLRGAGVGVPRIGFAEARSARQALRALGVRLDLDRALTAFVARHGVRIPAPAAEFDVRAAVRGQARASVRERDKSAHAAREWVVNEMERLRAERYTVERGRVDARMAADAGVHVGASDAIPTEPDDGEDSEAVESDVGAAQANPEAVLRERIEAARREAERAEAAREVERAAERAVAAREAGREQERLRDEGRERERRQTERLAAEWEVAREAERAAEARREAERESERRAAAQAEADREAREKAQQEAAAALAQSAMVVLDVEDSEDPDSTDPRGAERSEEPLEFLADITEPPPTEPPEDMDPPTDISSKKLRTPQAIAGEAPWGEVSGVIGDPSRMREKGPGKWVETGRSAEELVKDLPAGSPRMIDLSEPQAPPRSPTPWIILALVVVGGVAWLAFL